MAVRKVPMRQCTGCGEMKNKKDMIRVIKTPEGDITIDTTGKKNGRGAYICCSSECFHNAIKTKGIERSLKITIPVEIFEELEKELIRLESRK